MKVIIDMTPEEAVSYFEDMACSSCGGETEYKTIKAIARSLYSRLNDDNSESVNDGGKHYPYRKLKGIKAAFQRTSLGLKGSKMLVEELHDAATEILSRHMMGDGEFRSEDEMSNLLALILTETYLAQ